MIMADVNVEEPTCHSPRGRRKELKWQMSDSKVLKMRSAIMRKEHLSKNYYRNKRLQRQKLRKLANKVDCCHEIAPKLSNLDLITGSGGGGCGECTGGSGAMGAVRRTQPFMPKVQRYCDAVAGAAEVNPELIGEIIRDLHCVFEKTYGRKAKAEAHYRNLANEVEELKDDLACAECCKEELENELIKLHPELKALQFALEEEIQRRACLESIIAQQRAQIARADAMLDADSRDKAAMQGRIKDLEAQINKYEDMVYTVQSEKEDLVRNCRQFEDYKARQDESSSQCCQRMTQLEEALAKCCKANEEFQKEIVNIAKERDCLIAALESCENEKCQMAQEFECQRRQWMEEREKLEQMISDLRKAVECLTGQNQEICEKMREIVSAHHREMDTLRKDADRFKRLYENEQVERQKAEEAQKKCQEELRRKIAECQQKAMESQNNNNNNNDGGSSGGGTEGAGGGGSANGQTRNCDNPCAEILARINGRYWGRGGGGGGGCGGSGSSGGSGGSGGGNDGGGGGGGGSSGGRGGGRGSTGTSGTSENRAPPSDQVTNLQNQLQESNEKRTEQEQKIQNLESEVKTLKSRLRVQVVPVDDTNDRVEELEEELSRLQETLEEERNRREEVEQELATMKEELEEVQETNKELEEKIQIQDSGSQEAPSNNIQMEQLQDRLKNSEEIRLRNEEKIVKLEEELKTLEQNLSGESAERKRLEEELQIASARAQLLQEMMENEQSSKQDIQKSLAQTEARLDTEIREKEQLRVQTEHVDNNNNNDNNNNELDQNKTTELEDLKRKLEVMETEKLETDELLQKIQASHKETILAEQEKLNMTLADNQIIVQRLEQRLKLAEYNKTELYELRRQMEDAEKQKQELDQLKALLEMASQKRAEMEIMRENMGLLQQEKLDLENKCKRLKRSMEDIKSEMEDLRGQLQAAQAKAAEIEELQSSLKTAETEVEVLRQKLSLTDAQLTETEALRQELTAAQQQKATIEDHFHEFKEKLLGMEPKLSELSEQRRQMEDRLSAVMEENIKLKKIAEEHRMAHDLVQRELRDVHSMWETEVKAKGILAEKIAKYERMSSQSDARAKQEAEFIDRVKDKARQFKAELKAEREQSTKLKHKVDLLKEQLRTARDQLQELANDPRAQKLADHLEKQKQEHARVLHQIGKEREALMAEFYRLGQEKIALEAEVKQLKEQIAQESANDKKLIDKLITTKERLEAEMLSIKTLVNKRYVEKSVLDTLRKEHEANLLALKSKLESQAEQELTQKLNQIGAMLDTQTRDRVIIDNIRNANDSSIRSEFTAMVKNMKNDIERLNGLLSAREEEITTLRSCVTRFKDKVATETLEKNELIRKLQKLSASQESLTGK